MMQVVEVKQETEQTRPEQRAQKHRKQVTKCVQPPSASASVSLVIVAGGGASR